MLSLQMKSGDYFTIGEDVVVQVFKESSARIRVSIEAPREVPILRGAVRERRGESRPENLKATAPHSPSTLRHEEKHRAAREQKLRERQQAAQAQAESVARIESLLEKASLPGEVRGSLLRELSCLDAAAEVLAASR